MNEFKFDTFDIVSSFVVSLFFGIFCEHFFNFRLDYSIPILFIFILFSSKFFSGEVKLESLDFTDLFGLVFMGWLGTFWSWIGHAYWWITGYREYFSDTLPLLSKIVGLPQYLALKLLNVQGTSIVDTPDSLVNISVLIGIFLVFILAIFIGGLFND